MLYVYEREILTEIQNIVKRNREHIYLAVLYGSIVHNKHTPESDVDLFIVGEESFKKFLLEELSNLYLKYFIPVSILYYTLRQFNEIRNHPFIKKVLKEGRVIWEKKKID
ncbi:MAG: nucleotidyltransferase domain-containing protein [Candidatus Odinarchaeia archaeon]